MTIPQTPVFEGITAEECRRIYECFGVRERHFKPEEQIYDFGSGGHSIGILVSGSAIVERVDRRGDRTILEHLLPGGVFGEMLMFQNVLGDSIDVSCEKSCSVWFFPQEKLENRCEKNCGHHNRMIENMFHLIAEKATALSERVEVLSRRSIREKLLCYFSLQQAKNDGSFTLPFSLSALADYISTDRSAMMRELKKLRESGEVQIEGRRVTIPDGELVKIVKSIAKKI